MRAARRHERLVCAAFNQARNRRLPLALTKSVDRVNSVFAPQRSNTVCVSTVRQRSVLGNQFADGFAIFKRLEAGKKSGIS